MMEKSGGKTKVDNSEPKEATISKVKLDALEEMLENILLAFGGALILKMLKYIKSVFRLKSWLISLLEGVRKGKENHNE